MTVLSRCPSCGTPCKPSDSFCGACGADLVTRHPQGANAATAAQGQPNAAPSVRPPPTSARPAAPPPAGEPSPVSQKTIMGMTSPFVAGVPQPLHSGRPAGVTAPSSQRPAAPPPPARGPAANLRGTMMGIAPPVVGAGSGAPPASAPASTPLPPGPPSKRTMMGISPPSAMTPAREELARQAAAVLAQGGAPAGPPLPPASPVASTYPPPPASPLPPPPRSPAAALRPAPPPAGRSLPEQRVAAKTDRTMLGVPAPLRTTQENARAATTGATSSPALSITDIEAAGVRRKARAKRSVLRPLLAALAGALVVLLLGALAWHFASGPDLTVRVVQGEAGDALEIAVAGAPEGAKVRFADAEQPLRAGVALFPLAADALALGDNDLSIGVVRGDDVETSRVHLHVAYRARLDTTALDRDPPALSVVIEALPGASVTLDGAPLPLDARGRAHRSYPLGPQGGNKVAFEARYRIALAEGAVTEGVLGASVPVASVQVDRPGATVTTDQSSIEVAGAAEPGAELTVDGLPVKVGDDGRFAQRVKLPKLGEQVVRVRARSAGKVPRALALTVTRVADLAQAAAAFEPDPALTYETLAAGPVKLRGRKVAFEGQVYNVEVGGGASHLQMLVRACPRKQRCPLWVELSQAVEVGAGAHVRVLGTVAGEQQFRSERGQVHTVPSVHAQYVLKSSR